jgi:AraC-like DNA-binding protein
MFYDVLKTTMFILRHMAELPVNCYNCELVKIAQLDCAIINNALKFYPRGDTLLAASYMALLKFFKRKESLPTARDIGIGKAATGSANAAVSEVLQEVNLQSSGSTASRKRKHTVYTPGQRAAIGQYAAEHGNNSAVKKLTS